MSSARERLSEAIELFGHEGMLVVFHDRGDPFGTTAEGADLPPFGGASEPCSDLYARVAKVNARSRGELL